ncbi:MAG: hypothetical protein LBF15_04755 [Candidatus Peribacteria bacterium]|jgi:hypothetical protein|nr:hypothetical protein [Candidatus Peribacteria bacterium]
MIFKCTNEDIKLLARCDNDFGSSDVSKGHVYFQSGCSNTVTYKGTASYIPVTTPKS